MVAVTAIFVAVVVAAAAMIGHSLRLRAANQLVAEDLDANEYTKRRTVQVMWLVAAIPVAVFGVVGLIAMAYVANH